MEDTLRVRKGQIIRCITKVLILILMEDTLRALKHFNYGKTSSNVLILILMEDTLREYIGVRMVKENPS